MEITLKTLLAKPSLFFAKFDEIPPKWIISYLGYFLVTFVEAIGNLAYQDVPNSVMIILFRSLLSSLLGALGNLLFFGILWMYLGSKILRGTASLKAIVQAVGYAFFYPGIFSLLLTVPFMLLTAGLGNDTPVGVVLIFVVLPLQLILALWSMVYSAIAVKRLNNFGWAKTFGVLAWFPVLLIIAAIVIRVI